MALHSSLHMPSHRGPGKVISTARGFQVRTNDHIIYKPYLKGISPAYKIQEAEFMIWVSKIARNIGNATQHNTFQQNVNRQCRLKLKMLHDTAQSVLFFCFFAIYTYLKIFLLCESGLCTAKKLNEYVCLIFQLKYLKSLK